MHAVNRKSLYLSLVVGVLSLLTGHSSFAQGTAFLYQGQLGNGGSPANGSYDFQFTVYNAITNGQAVSSTVTNTGVAVNNGLFTATLDFGTGIFTGTTNVWLNLGVRTNNTATFAFLSPRQPILATPYAIFANSASNLVGVLPASQLSGTLPASAFTGYTNSVALTNGANLFSGAFSGNGGSVTNVNVSNLAGILAASQLPTNTAYVNSNNTFTASNTFTGNNTFNGANVFTNLTGNSFSGSFFGNGLVGWVVVPGTTVQASIDHGYLLTNQQVDTVTLPPTANVGDIVRIAGAGSTGWQVAQNAGQSVLGNFITYGKVWTLTSQNGEWDSMASSSDGTRMILGNMNSGTFISVNSGASWGNVFSTEVQVVGVASSADGTHLACVVTNGGEIYVSVNSGSTWSPLGAANWTAVASSSSGNQFVAVAANQGIATFSTTAAINNYANTISWSSVASSANGSNLVASAYNGSIYLSANAGASWNPSSSGVKNWKAVASSADGTKLVAAVYGGGIYSSINSGGSWSPTLAPAENWVSLASSSDGSKLIAVANGGGVFTSANWGTTWLLQTNAVPTATTWGCCASSASGSTLATAINFPTSGGIYTSQAAAQTSTTAGTTGYLSGSQGSAAELQCIGNGQFMPISSVGTIWGN
jgi:hypothetical protein